jgi:hypothetical protein
MRRGSWRDAIPALVTIVALILGVCLAALAQRYVGGGR